MRSGWVVVALVACGGKAPAAVGPDEPDAPGTTTNKPADKQAACVTTPETIASISNATANGTRVQYCIGTGADCFTLDVSTGAFARATVPKPAVPAGARIETADPKLDVCTNGSCTSLTPKVLPNSTTLRAATNTDGTHAVVLLGDAPKGRGYAEVWDVAKSKRAAMFRYARGDFRCGEVAMLDATTIYLNAAECGQPSARGGLYKLDGRKIANVGGKDFGTYGGAHLRIDTTTWAFLEENGNQIVIQDIVKGKVLKTIDTSLLFKNGGAEMGNPGESALVRFTDGKLGVIAGAPATGSVATIDVTSGEIAIVPAPLCKR